MGGVCGIAEDVDVFGTGIVEELERVMRVVAVND